MACRDGARTGRYGVSILLALWLTAAGSRAARAAPAAMEELCATTPHPDSCVASLAAHPDAATAGPPQLAIVGVAAAIAELGSFLSYASAVLSRGDGAGEASAFAACQSVLGDAQESLQRSLGTLGALNPGTHRTQMADALTWLSAALTDHTTCLDSVGEKAGSAKAGLVNARAASVTRLLSNAVALVAALGSLGATTAGDHSRRRRRVLNADSSPVFALRGDGFPEWMRPAERKLLQSTTTNLTIADAVVAADGSGQYRSVQAAVDAAPRGSAKKWAIYVKAGVYSENVEVPKAAKNLVIFGDGMGKTVITGDRSVVGSNVTTFATATMAVLAPSFLGRDFTVRNTAGAINHQAVALKVQGDKAAFWRCAVEGYQDTLYVHSNRQFFKACSVSGTVDFVFGNAAAVFQSCTLLARRPLPGQQNTFTAQGRTSSAQSTGLSFQSCVVDAAEELRSGGGGVGDVRSYLGRPWKEYSRTVFMACDVGDVVAAEGWLAWNADFALRTLFYGEYKNGGAGGATAARVPWATQIRDAAVANAFTVDRFIMAAEWLPETAIAYDAALYADH